MRSTDIMSYVGQSHILGLQCMLYKFLSKTEIPNLILWGPPGWGRVVSIFSKTCLLNSRLCT